MALQQRSVVSLDAREIVVAIVHDPAHWQPWVMQGGNVRHGRKRILEHERAGAIFCRERNGHRASQRSSHQDHFVWLDRHSQGEPMLRGTAVGDTTGFSRPPLAMAVAAVVENEHGRTERLTEMRGKLAERGDIFAVAVAVKDRSLRIALGNEPAL